jgi:TRAP transporter TAXI family solute receptor
MKKTGFPLALLFAAIVFASPAQATQFVNIATGPTGGTYYPVGAAMAKIWTDNIKDVKANAQSTGGTFNNISLLGSGEAEACFADGLYYDAYNGKGRFDGNPQNFMRGVVVLYPEIIHMVVGKDSGINSFADLKGKRVSFGAVGGSVTATSESIFRAAGLDPEKDLKIEYLGHADSVAAFADKRIDAAVTMGAIGISSVVEPTTVGTVKIISLPRQVVEAMCAQSPYFSPAVIPAGTYKGQDEEIATFSSPNIIAVHEKMNADLVYEMTKQLLAHKSDLEAVAAVMAAMKAESVDQIRIPLHPGAERYFKELGLLK